MLTTYTPDASPAKLLSQPTVPKIAVDAQSPSDSTTSPGRYPLEGTATADLRLPGRQDLFQSNKIRSDDPRAMKRTTSESEHREQSAHSSSSDLVNQEATSQSQETQAPKKHRMLKKVFAAFRGKKSVLAESTPNESAQGTVGDTISVKDDGTLSVPSAVHSFAGNRLDQQAEIQ